MNFGELTAQMARELAAQLGPLGYDVFFDLGDKNTDTTSIVGRIVSWIGDEYSKNSRLAFLDIAVVEREPGAGEPMRAVALVEIEEGHPTPKVILGDLLATLFGDHLAFGGTLIGVGSWTTLIVLAHSEHDRPIFAFLQDQVNQLKSVLSTGNAAIGRTVVSTYENEQDLRAQLNSLIVQNLRNRET